MALNSFNHKSSVLCPKTRHITTQYLALEQIEAHHKMVSHAKHNLDMAAPKSMKSYISNVDRKKKSFWPCETSLRYQSTSLVKKNTDEILQNNKNLQKNGKPQEDKETIHTSISLNKSIQAGVPYPTLNSKVADKISWYLEAVSQGEFQTQSLNQQNFQNGITHHYGSQISLSSSLRSYKVVKGDLIDWHKSHFTSTQNSFSPRILANNITKSKVRTMRCYNPPQRKESQRSGESSATFDSYDDDEEEEEEEEVDEKDSEMKETSNDENDNSVRDIDTDQQNWLSDQALRAELRQKFGTKFKHQSCTANILKSDVHSSSKKYSSIALSTISRDEENNYLKFLTDVTEDILRGGVYSDRAIQQTFEFHLQFCSENSDKDKLKHLLDQMLEGLGAHNDDNEDLISHRKLIPAGNENSLEKVSGDGQKHLKGSKPFSIESSGMLESNPQNDMSNLSLNHIHSDVEKNVNSEIYSVQLFNKES